MFYKLGKNSKPVESIYMEKHPSMNIFTYLANNWRPIFYSLTLGMLSGIFFTVFCLGNGGQITFQSPIEFKNPIQVNHAEEKVLSPIPTDTITPTILPTKSPTKAPPKVVPFKKYLTPQAATIREVILARIQSEYDEVNALAFDNIIKKESGYRPDAMNEIGAGGIAQALPASKMGCPIEAKTEAALCQYEWMKKYIENRYGTPVKAWEFHLAMNWY